MIEKHKLKFKGDVKQVTNTLLLVLLDLNFSDDINYNTLLKTKHSICNSSYDPELLNLLEKVIYSRGEQNE